MMKNISVKEQLQIAADAMHTELLKQVEILMEGNPEAGSYKAQELIHLATIIENYEKVRYEI